MSIVAVISSPRKNGNTEAIVSSIIEGAKENGKNVEIFRINPMTNRRGCQACMGCKKAGHCVINDDLTPVLDAIRNADGVILSTPDYFGEACGQYRLLEDRMFGFLNGDMSININAGKKVAIIVTCGSAYEGAVKLADKIEGSMVNFFKCESVGKIVMTDGGPPNAASENKEILTQAKAIGKKF